MVWITAWSHTLRSGSGSSGAIPKAVGDPGSDARCGPPAVRASLASWAGTMELRPEACASPETRVSPASLGRPTGVCCCRAVFCVALLLSVGMVGRHRGGNLAMGVPGHPVPTGLLSPSGRTKEGSALRLLRQTGPPLLRHICAISPLPPLGGASTRPRGVSGGRESLPPHSVALADTWPWGWKNKGKPIPEVSVPPVATGLIWCPLAGLHGRQLTCCRTVQQHACLSNVVGICEVPNI